jgi:ubiquinone biosynthesis protein
VVASAWRALRDAALGRLAPDSGRRGRTGQHVVEAIASLGPTFIKLGQVLSTRPDLIPPRLEEILASLQDAAPPVEEAAIRAVFVAEMGQLPEAVYSSFERRPLAAASIGQVHGAVLADGRAVVVKIRRPAVRDTIADDLAILTGVTSLSARHLRVVADLDLVGFVEEFAATITAECDYLAEGHNADRLRNDLAPLGIVVPEVIWEHTTSGVLTLERIVGAKIDDLAALDAMGVDRPALAVAFARAYLTMVFANGFFHADPHPGNLFVDREGRLALVDFGMVGTVPPAVRAGLIEILLALTTGDMGRSAAALHALGIARGQVDEEDFVREVDRLTQASIHVPVGELRIAPLLMDLMTVSRRHHLRFPRELALLVKTVVMCEGLAAGLDPHFALPVVLVGFAAEHFGDDTPPPA